MPTQSEIETKLKTSFTGLSDANIKILAHYMYLHPKKWRFDDEYFTEDVNKILPEAYAYNLRPSNIFLGAVIALVILLFFGLIWWGVSTLINKNNKNILDDPSSINLFI